MAYEITFYGSFAIEPPLSKSHREYLLGFCGLRHTRRRIEALEGRSDPLREQVGLPLGEDGAFSLIEAPDYRAPEIIDYNRAAGQPGAYCFWTPTPTGDRLIWNGQTAFREPVKWLRYLIDTFLNPWGYRLTGAVRYQGEMPDDAGWLIAEGAVGSQVIREEPINEPTHARNSDDRL